MICYRWLFATDSANLYYILGNNNQIKLYNLAYSVPKSQPGKRTAKRIYSLFKPIILQDLLLYMSVLEIFPHLLKHVLSLNLCLAIAQQGKEGG